MVRSIVADPRYRLRVTGRAPQASWLDALGAWITGVMRGLLYRLDRALGAHNSFEAAIGFGVIAAALVLVGLGTSIVVRSYLRGAAAPPASSVDARVPAAEQSSAALRAAARSAARLEHYRDAAALLFLSAERGLHERGQISFDPARTSGEYRRLVRDPLFDALAGDAVVALFAAAEPRADLFERMSRTYDRFFDAYAR